MSEFSRRLRGNQRPETVIIEAYNEEGEKVHSGSIRHAGKGLLS